MIDLDKYSSESKSQIKIVLELLINALELKDSQDKFALKIPRHAFTKNHIEYNEALRILVWISQGDSLFVVLNEKYKRLLRESEPYMSGWEAKNDELKNAYYKLGITEEDLQKYLLLQINDDNCIKELKLLEDKLNKNPLQRDSYKMTFFPVDGLASFQGNDYLFKGKSKALLILLNECKNTPFTDSIIMKTCNPNISNKRHYFKADKDIRDTVNYMREKLKVNKGEFFPIQKRNLNWIWIEK